MGRLVWIIDEEWPDYEVERALLQKELPQAEIRFSSYDYASDLEAFGKDADIILAQIYVDMPAAVLRKLRHCRGIAVYGGGYDRIDVAAARQQGIPVTNVNDYCREDIAEYVLAAMFSCTKQLNSYAPALRQGAWGAQAVPRPPHRLTEQTLFIAGCGRIGCFVAQKAKALGMRVIGYDPHAPQGRLDAAGIEPVSMEQGFRAADFVSVHIKCDASTEHLLDGKYFSLMKPTAYLINTSRGRILDEAALIGAVRARELAGAVLDVITDEPPLGTEAILKTPGILVTPHISYISTESYRDLKQRAVYNALDMLRGRRPADLVN